MNKPEAKDVAQSLEGMKVDIYWNLHRGGFSIRSRETETYGKVLAHMKDPNTTLLIWQPEYVVQKAGHEKVLREQKKNVHAFIRGTIDGMFEGMNIEQMNAAAPTAKNGWDRRAVSYNPYKMDSFYERETEAPIESSDFAMLGIREDKPVVIAEDNIEVTELTPYGI